MVKIKKNIFENIFLLLVFGILLWMGMGSYFEHKLDYDIPRGFMAGDSIYKYNRVVYLDETGDNKYVPPNMEGGVENVTQTYPYLTFHNPVLFKDISGLKLYNSNFFMQIFYAILGGLLGYILIRRYNKKIALLSTGILGFLFIKNFYIGFIFGWNPLIFGSLLLVGIFWVMLNYELKGFNFLLGIMIAASFLTHPSETVFGILIVIILFIPKYIKRKFDFNMIKRSLIAIFLMVILTAYYIPIFFKSFIGQGGASTSIYFGPAPKTFPVPYFLDLGVYGWLVILGFIVLVFLLLTKKIKNWEHFVLLFVMSFVTFSVSFIAIGGHRAYQNRFFWPIYLSILFGLSIYTILKLIPIKIPKIIYYIIPILLLIISATYYFEPIQSNGLIVNQEMWDGMNWVNNNVGNEEKALIFYGDSYNQHALVTMFGLPKIYFTDINYLPNRPSYLKVLNYSYDETIFKIEKGTITRNFSIKFYSHNNQIYEKMGFSEEIVKNGGFNKNEDICGFDYIIIDKLSRFQQFMIYNHKLREKLLENNHIKEVFSNSWYSILKNNEIGENCIKDEKQ